MSDGSDERVPREAPGGPHFVVPPAVIGDEHITLGDEDSHHLATVLRCGPGDPVSVADGMGTRYWTRVAEIGSVVALAITAHEEVPTPRPALRVVVGTPKGKKLDDIVRQLTELGVDRIAPAIAAHSESRPSGEGAERAIDRWRAVAHAAAKQSRRAYLPTIEPIASWAEAFDDERGVVCWEGATTPLIDEAGALSDHRAITLAVGPEGGLTREEVAATGLAPVGLGDTVLRTETAAVAAAAVTLALVSRLG
ncbi:16S rRNA (uracil(1498)-N(3))-methyltransferase [Egibacter rhizosphaerae]|uniref:Ribosomal RNA small subunit methyltransferase E n=1 Tax=Egibacter rhizosphaerae TaxID=1670831 RepID=A0A411YBV6_9ACTN|nr:RsmE family RNA methyltransferase [Egibacter rhizosphaerae]QBI18637.1 16S rRNA (uracil(1498)-N(3))-methyltransferase [Egibacter rhizosphaerae]